MVVLNPARVLLATRFIEAPLRMANASEPSLKAVG